MPGSPYLDERPKGLLTWPLLMPLLLAIFVVELIVGVWVWMQYPDWRFLVYIILGIDLVVLVVFYVLTTRGSEGDE
jgi:asparagine N-glycosylation enzyme membrane subunit Stt3